MPGLEFVPPSSPTPVGRFYLCSMKTYIPVGINVIVATAVARGVGRGLLQTNKLKPRSRKAVTTSS